MQRSEDIGNDRSMLSTLRGRRLLLGEDVEVSRQNVFRTVDEGPTVGIEDGRVLPKDLCVRVVGRTDDDRGADGFAVELKVDIILLPLEPDGIGGERPDLLAVDGDGDGDVPARVKVAIGVGNVDLGLECAGGRVERKARTDDLALAGSARERLEADERRVVLVDEVRGQ